MKLLLKKWKRFLNEAKVDFRISYDDAHKMAEDLIDELGVEFWEPNDDGESTFEEGRGIPVGSLRQKKDTIGDIDILVTRPVSVEEVEDIEGVEEVTSRGSKQIFFDYTSPETGITRPINIFVSTEPDRFGGMLMHTTGPSKYNILLRMIAKRAGGKASQYGVFDPEGNQIGGETEASYYRALKTKKWPEGKEWKAPELRGK